MTPCRGEDTGWAKEYRRRQKEAENQKQILDVQGNNSKKSMVRIRRQASGKDY